MNPYQEWLQCRSKRPHYFELLGVSPQETDSEKIRRSAASRLAAVRRVRPGEYLDLWQSLIDEINEAERVLLDPEARRTYVQKLRAAREKKKAGDSPPKSESPSPPMVTSTPVPTAPPIPSAPPQRESPKGAAAASPDPNAPLTAPRPTAESVGGEAFDPMAPLTAPEIPASQPALAGAAATTQAGSPSSVDFNSMSGGSSGLAAFTRKRTQRKRRNMFITGVLSLVVVGLLGTLVVLNQDAILGSKVSEAEVVNDPASSTDGETESETAGTTPDQPNSPPSDEETDAETNNSPTDNIDSSSDPDSSAVDPTSDPEMTGPDDPTTPSIDPPPSEPSNDPETPERSLTRPEAYALGETLKAAHVALSERNFEEAEALWTSAREQASGSDYSDLVDRLQIVGQTTRRCWDQIAKAAGQLQSSEVLEFSPTVAVAIIEASEDRLVYRVNGERQERAPRELPPGLGKLILETVLDPGTELDTLLGALYAAESAVDETKREQAETYWREADASGASVPDLIQWLSDEYDLVAEDYDPEPTPEEADLAEAEAALTEELAAIIDAAKKPDDRVAAGLQIVEKATAQEATPETYVKFQKACELIAMSGQSTQLETPVELWEQWFKLDRIAVMTDLLERCSRITAEPEECKETVRLSLELAKQAVNKKEVELAERLLDAATDAAQKSKDVMTRSETLLAVRQLKDRLKGN